MFRATRCGRCDKVVAAEVLNVSRPKWASAKTIKLVMSSGLETTLMKYSPGSRSTNWIRSCGVLVSPLEMISSSMALHYKCLEGIFIFCLNMLRGQCAEQS